MFERINPFKHKPLYSDYVEFYQYFGHFFSPNFYLLYAMIDATCLLLATVLVWRLSFRVDEKFMSYKVNDELYIICGYRMVV